MNEEDQLPLFDVPAAGQRWRKQQRVSPSIRYSKIRPRHRILCDDCCLDIHKLGQMLAPLPRRASWRRTDKAGSMSLCQAHKDERHDDESS